jgi:hypothetical protein
MAKTKKFKVMFADGSHEIHEAARMDRDGSGCRLFDEDGDMIAAWADGEYKSCAVDVKREGGPAPAK